MRLWLSIGICLFSTGALCGSPAFFHTGIELLRLCDGDIQDQPLCLGYIMGVNDTQFTNDQILAKYFDTTPRYNICAQGVSADQLRLVVIKYMKDRPEGLHYQASSIVGAALGSAFPCQ